MRAISWRSIRSINLSPLSCFLFGHINQKIVNATQKAPLLLHTEEGKDGDQQGTCDRLRLAVICMRCLCSTTVTSDRERYFSIARWAFLAFSTQPQEGRPHARAPLERRPQCLSSARRGKVPTTKGMLHDLTAGTRAQRTDHFLGSSETVGT